MKGSAKQALYRRYRSMSFDDVVGQEHVTALLKNAVSSGKTSHAYLFTGPRGTGKTSVARILAYAINDLPYNAEAAHLDIIEIDAASNRRIDDIRDLREKVHVAPVSAKYKVYIVDEVHMLTGESFNALLKTLEEPPAHVVFILATTELHKVPATIVSRTQRFHFRPITTQKIMSHLANIAGKEGISIDDEALRLVAEHGGGSFRDSIGLLDQLGSLGQAVDAETVETILGRARAADIEQVIDALQNRRTLELQTLLENITASGTSPVTLSEQLVRTLLARSQPEVAWYTLTEKLMSVPKAHFPELLLASVLLGFSAGGGEIARSQDGKMARGRDGERAESQDREMGISQDGKRVRSQDGEIARLQEGEFDWEKVLAAVKKTNPALHAVLQRAEAHFAENTLTVSFRYALHRKKLEQTQYQTELRRTIQDVCGQNTELVIAEPGSQLVLDGAAKKIADLMGGGELV